MIPGTPDRELGRSRAAERVRALAEASGLLQFHYQHRVGLSLPEWWVPAHDPALADPAPWIGGSLAERKYQSFRHDLAVGSFHPGQRGKWSAHELCHGLVGFAWRPAASPLFHATAGRLAELLPVALWYWFDEADRTRCPRHAGGGALFRTYCRACDGLAGHEEGVDEAMVEAGRAYVRAELAAIDRTIESGVVHAHRYATLDLSSDGVAYAAAHGERLASAGFEEWVQRFAVRGGGWSDSLEILRDRVHAVLAAVVDGAPLAALAPTPVQGRWRWILQDVAWRLEVVRTQCEDDVADELDALIDRLADAVPATIDPGEDATSQAGWALQEVAAAYVDLNDDVELLPPTELFAVGYPLPGPAGALGDEGSRLQLADGLTTCVPASRARVGDDLGALVQSLIDDDRADPRRDHLADRWAAALTRQRGPDDPVAQLARFEAATTVAPRRIHPVLAGVPRDGRWRLVPGVRIEQFTVDVGAALPMRPIPERRVALVVARDPGGEAIVAELEDEVAEVLLGLGSGAPLALPPAAVAELQQLGVIEPVARVL